MVSWIISVTDIDAGKGVANAKVCLFVGGGIADSEPADYTQYTGANGVTVFDCPAGFYHVGVFAAGYESAYEPHDPPTEWLDVWTCWGAGGAGHDYDFAVRYIGEEPPNGNGDGLIEKWTNLPVLQKALIVTSGILSMCGLAYLVTRRKRT